MLDCRNLAFSPKLSAARIEAAKVVFGEAVLWRIAAFALYILGCNRARISDALGMPAGTVRSLIRRLLGSGVEGFLDHRRKAATEAAVPQEDPQPALTVPMPLEKDALVICGGQLELPEENPIQRKVVLLSLIGEGLLSAEDVAPALGLSISHVRRLHRDLMASDVQAVLDKRRGQLRGYRVGPELKGQMIVEFVLELAECGRASGTAVARRLGLHCDEHLPERTVRHHLNRMGLTSVRELLIAGLQEVKRGSGR
jgi:AraC-like DNA-binding protein